jgi:ice-binding like protein
MKRDKQIRRAFADGLSDSQTRSRGTRDMRLLGLAALTALAGAGCRSSPEPDVGRTADAVDQTVLSTAQAFAVLAGSTVTNTGATAVDGNLGVDPGLAVTGFPPGLVAGGTVHAGDAVALQAQSDVTTAYNTLAGESLTQDLTGQDLGGKTLTPGVYRFSSSAQLTGALTLDAQGDPRATFVFQIGSTLTTASNASVLVLDGASDCNIFWQVGSSATLGTTTALKGNILALTSITLVTGARVSGRVLARNGAVTMDTNDVSIANCAPLADAGVDGGGNSSSSGSSGSTGSSGSGSGGSSSSGSAGSVSGSGSGSASPDSGAGGLTDAGEDGASAIDARADACDAQPEAASTIVDIDRTRCLRRRRKGLVAVPSRPTPGDDSPCYGGDVDRLIQARPGG